MLWWVRTQIFGFVEHLEQFVLTVHIEHVRPNEAEETLTSTYDPLAANTVKFPHTPQSEVPFQNVVISDVDGNAPSNEL